MCEAFSIYLCHPSPLGLRRVVTRNSHLGFYGARFRLPQNFRRWTCAYNWSQPLSADAELDAKIVTAERGLDSAVKREDYASAAHHRDQLTHLQSKNFVEVLQANLRFYNALNRGDIVDIARAFMQGPHVTCKHPLGKLVTGYLNVINSFAELFGGGVPILSVTDVRVQPRGSVAYVTCMENLVLQSDPSVSPSSLPGSEYNQAFVQRYADIKFLATNIFEKKNGEWYIIHHTAMPITVEDMFHTS